MTALTLRIEATPRRRRDTVLAGLELLAREGPPMNLSMARAFLYIAENPGLGVGELADLMHVPDPTASRSARALGQGAKALVRAAPNRSDRRGLALHLTPLGAELVERLDALIAAPCPIRRGA